MDRRNPVVKAAPEHCRHCGAPAAAHFGPDKDWPKGVCMCGMPDVPCGCPGFEPEGT